MRIVLSRAQSSEMALERKTAHSMPVPPKALRSRRENIRIAREAKLGSNAQRLEAGLPVEEKENVCNMLLFSCLSPLLCFKCPKIFEPQQPCCCRRLLYNEPDFRSVVSLVEQECSQRNFEVLFLPKFHCELNFIEQCWGYAKRVYREFPPSKSDTEMEGYVMKALSSVKVETMRQLVLYFE